MANKKRQHFISQFLLRSFSIATNSKSINLYLKGTNKVIESAPIKSQAQQKYYYGEDAIFEDYLAHSENTASKVINHIKQDYALPNLETKNYSFLLHFVMMYAFRTKASVANTEEKINSGIRKIAQYDKSLSKIDFSKYRVAHPEPAAFNLAHNMDNWVITGDLSLGLLKNETTTEFIISDNPFIQFNPIQLSRKKFPNNGGLLSTGLIIFFPISPKLYLIYYDKWAYKINFDDERSVSLTDDYDIHNLNLLQAISSEETIYFSSEKNTQYIKNLADEASWHKKDKHVNDEVEDKENPDKKLLLSYYLEHLYNPDFTFIKLTDAARMSKDSIGMNSYRNDEIVEWMKMDKSKLKRNN
ncbi:DUF4238 domain-containing protein [Cellulophaga baltica]|uniref:DUF4238 domain-containing protein n=1 Tax=Cellulophaga baltica TaxID=76594 RepID=UPI0024952B7F|nr:DUF4238 domain-containing protein [Cellulophaga baltica]